MKKTILIYGLIAGIVVAIPMLFTANLCHSDSNFDYTKSMLVGYASMIIAFSLIFVGVRNYRNNYNDGIISFGKAFKVGLFIALVASSIYVIGWLIEYYCFIPDFAEKYSAHEMEQLRKKGASAAELAEETKKMASFIQMYKNPLVVILMTYAEILPVGLLVTLISSLILKRKDNKTQFSFDQNK
ncbi:DUF4199 domain-containing protein [Taibaiella lutea]|uniref:DUF4199 domain-containing protein n=2 Tax=Taibaiella lutea TaxID=2608001 RepID=A0A5M6CT11_9BACT|nr:DUF4199 domain-containing protein [Taibaiella lutea]